MPRVVLFQRLHGTCTTSVCSIPRRLSSATLVGDLSSWSEHFPLTSMRLVCKEHTRPSRHSKCISSLDARDDWAAGADLVGAAILRLSPKRPLHQSVPSSTISPGHFKSNRQSLLLSRIFPSHRGCLLCGRYQYRSDMCETIPWSRQLHT